MAHDGPKSFNTMWTFGHFALFVLVNVSNNELDKVLQEAFDGYRCGEYNFWLADTWSNALVEGEAASKPPIAEDWRSPFVGKTIEGVVAFMKELPEDRYIDYHHFAVLGEDYTRRRMMTIYRIGDEYLVGDELDALTSSVAGKSGYQAVHESHLLIYGAVAGSTVFLSSMHAHLWEESKGNEPVYGDG